MSRGRTSKQAIHAGRASLDAAIEYLRHRGQAVVGWYFLAATPLIAAAWWWIGCMTTGDRLGLTPACIAVTAAMLWRWAWLAKVQQVVMTDMGMPSRPLTLGLMGRIVLVRLIAHVGMVWGSLLIVPGLWSFYVSALVSPATLSPDRPVDGALRACLALVARHLGLLARHGMLLSLLMLLALVMMAGMQLFFLQTLLPSLMGMDSADLVITMSHLSWFLFILLVVLLAFDLYWSVGAVLLMQQLEARRTGSDLMARLTVAREAV